MVLCGYEQQLELHFKPRDMPTPQEVETWYETELKWWGDRQLKFVAIATVIQISALGMISCSHVNQQPGVLMNDYIIGWIMIMCLFYVSIGEKTEWVVSLFRTDPLLSNPLREHNHFTIEAPPVKVALLKIQIK